MWVSLHEKISIPYLRIVHSWHPPIRRTKYFTNNCLQWATGKLSSEQMGATDLILLNVVFIVLLGNFKLSKVSNVWKCLQKIGIANSRSKSLWNMDGIDQRWSGNIIRRQNYKLLNDIYQIISKSLSQGARLNPICIQILTWKGN